ncbi:MAG: tRNA (guanosine(46)-N7)-methyltransferase TrmB [Rhodothermales bacterium]
MLLDLARLDIPSSSRTLFGRSGPLVMEVGFGDGWFLAHLAREHPDWNVLGAEVSLGSVRRAFQRVRREGLTNARLYRGHARFIIRNVIPPRSLHRIYVNFPDPWPKKRHRDRRLLQAPFFRLLSTRLEQGGALLFTTDHAKYFDFALEEARATGLYDLVQGPPPLATLQTKYARKWRAQDLSIQHAVFTKTGEAEESYAPTVETHHAMHHAILEGDLPPLDTFDKLVHPFKGGHLIVLEAFRPVEDEGLLFVARIEEEDFTQDVLIEARPTRKGEASTLVGLKPFGQPLATRGTREAVGFVTAWLEQQGMHILQQSF